MIYRVRIAPIAQRQIDEFANYLREYSEEFAAEQIGRLDRTISVALSESPLTWAYFPLTGAPTGPSSFAWDVGPNIGLYTVGEDARVIDILHFWNVSRSPDTLEI